MGRMRVSLLHRKRSQLLTPTIFSSFPERMNELQRKSHLCFPRKGIARPQSQFPHSCVCERFYIFPGSVHIFSCSRIGRPHCKCSVSQFLNSYICERILYFQDRSTYFAAGKYVDGSREYINCSQDTWMWKLGLRPRNSQKRTSQMGFSLQCDISIDCSQTNEWGNQDWGRAIPFLGIFVSNFRYCVFAVCMVSLHILLLYELYALLGTTA